MLEELENPENYRKYFKDCCVTCGVKIPTFKGWSMWMHYKFFGNFCVSCDHEVGRRLFKKKKTMTLAEIHAQQMANLWNFIMNPSVKSPELTKEEIIDDKIRDEIKYENKQETDCSISE